MGKKIVALCLGAILAAGGLSLSATSAAAQDSVQVTVSGTLLGVDGQPLVDLQVWISDDPWDGCQFPFPDGQRTQADGSFSFVFDADLEPRWPYMLCLGREYYGGPTWSLYDRVYVDLSRDLDIGVVQRAPSVKVKMRWLVDRDFIGLVNEDSTSQAHAINLDTGSVYRGNFGRWEGDGVWETLELPLGRYRFAVRTLWWDPQTWVYYPGTMSPEEGEVIDVREDMTLPQEVQANPGIVKVGKSVWGTDRDWRIESCTTDWSYDYVHEQYFDPEPNQWVLPIGSYRLALYRGDELWDWTPCIQIEPHGVYEAQWTQKARAIPPRSVTASVAEDESSGQRLYRVTAEVAPGAVNTFLPTKSYRVDVIREDSGQSVANTWVALYKNFRTPFSTDVKAALPAGRYVVSVTSSVEVDGKRLSSEPVRSASFEVSDPVPSPTPSPTSTPTPTSTPSPTPMPTSTPSPSPSPTPTPTPMPTSTPTPTAEPTSSPTASPSATASPAPVPSSSPPVVPGAPQPGPDRGAGGAPGSPRGGGSLAETGALAPPLALAIFAVAALVAAGLLRLVSRRDTQRAGQRRH